MFYHTRQWRTIRQQRLRAEPLCRFCKERGFIVAATVCDHVIAHRGDENLFFDYENTQSLCKRCHDSAKQSEESRGFSRRVGVDGWPTDPRHPMNLYERKRNSG